VPGLLLVAFCFVSVHVTILWSDGAQPPRPATALPGVVLAPPRSKDPPAASDGQP
jgi:hypothetical protein